MEKSMTISTYPYWNESQLGLYWYSPPGTVAKRTRYNTISWDSSKTQIISAKIHGIISAPMGTTGQIYFNNELTHWCDARLGNASNDAEVDVIGLFREGENGITIELTKFAGLEQVGTFSATLILEFTGTTPPEVTPPTEPLQLQWYHYALAIIAILGVGYLAFRPHVQPIIVSAGGALRSGAHRVREWRERGEEE